MHVASPSLHIRTYHVAPQGRWGHLLGLLGLLGLLRLLVGQLRLGLRMANCMGANKTSVNRHEWHIVHTYIHTYVRTYVQYMHTVCLRICFNFQGVKLLRISSFCDCHSFIFADHRFSLLLLPHSLCHWGRKTSDLGHPAIWGPKANERGIVKLSIYTLTWKKKKQSSNCTRGLTNVFLAWIQISVASMKIHHLYRN